MAVVIVINLFLVALAAIVPNEFLAWHSYLFYGLQALSTIPFLLHRSKYLGHLFLPSFFVLVYVLANLTFGAYLVPREFGWNKDFAPVVTAIQHYRLIVPFFLLSNGILFCLTASALKKLAHASDAAGARTYDAYSLDGSVVLKTGFYFAAFFVVSYYQVFNALSFQLALLILHLTDRSVQGRRHRYAIYTFYLLVSLAFSFENKRDIAMILFSIVFLEAYFGGYRLKATVGNLAAYCLIVGSFMALILAASIMRGYGQFSVTSVLAALYLVPAYIGSELFINSIADNLELTYNYGVTVTSIDHVLRAQIDYRYGASLVKVLFLPIPRDVFAFKPESAMQVFTQVFAPHWWVQKGSMPVGFASDMFMNFHYFGLFVYALVLSLINRAFLFVYSAAPRSFLWYSCVFLSITVLLLARGGGIEQWLLYYLLATPVLLLIQVTANSCRTHSARRSRWVV